MNTVFVILTALFATTSGSGIPPHSIVRKGDQVAVRIPADVCLLGLRDLPYHTNIKVADRYTTITVTV